MARIAGNLLINGEEFYPNPYMIGDIYITTNSANPNTIYGGVWSLLCPGRTLVCVDSSDSVINTSKKTGGSVNPLTYHRHDFTDGGRVLYWDAGLTGNGGLTSGTVVQSTWNSNTKYVGDNTNHANWQPFMAVYMWLRTA